ncbi:MAG: hypothetical protein AUK47_09070 [Deltaproteobacteria bacterium CG2_30_63_29]|nr:MAG: hypothetical protein AUK47_09070 [Deltaproteobacteria bacterium CG2_30_63_29]PJB42311.1 MAG: hypothetical protein CO108_11880 [Deltaproteobacteria bacterium CG_4_9_14_3_um_filter_63_12]
MKNLGFLLILVELLAFVGCSDVSQSADFGRLEGSAIFGNDDRTDLYLADPVLQTVARESVVALMLAQELDISNPNDIGIVSVSLGYGYGLCGDERFWSQPTAAFCSGTLIDDDLVLTAGHCIEAFSDCHSTAFVFDYFYEAEGQLATISSQDVYHCKQLLVQEFSTAISGSGTSGQDYAIVQLDRPVDATRSPRPVNLSHAPLAMGEKITVIGFPTGLPAKVEAVGEVIDPQPVQLERFTHNSDTFGGNSGSGALDSNLSVAGILVLGINDYEESAQGCWVPSVYPAYPSLDAAIESNYVYGAIDALCALGWPSARLCAVAPVCGDGFCSGTETSSNCADCAVPSCGDGTCNFGEWQSCPADCGWMNPPAGWGCEPRNYGRLDGCDCGCGLIDPDCSDPSAEVFGCLHGQTCTSGGICAGTAQPISNWTCQDWQYAGRNGCDCGCGAHDPDCDDSFAYGNCGLYEACNQNDFCANVLSPEGWNCEPYYFDAGDGCDCNCGSRDPDCDNPMVEVFNCLPEQICDEAGRCRTTGIVPTTWTCAVESYADGQFCDCQCGADDPDCGLTSSTRGCAALEKCVSGQCVPSLPPEWTCEPSFYDARDGCDCLCGVQDPDCAFPDQVVFNCNEGVSCVEGYCDGNWYCELWRRGNGVCDCDCGEPDPDCITEEQRIAACQPGYICEAGSCTWDIPTVWTCDPNYYATGGCDCDCGIWDPDCDLQPKFARGCAADEVCMKPGVCGPASLWTCEAGTYEDGRTCNCKCGSSDPDCTNLSLPVEGCVSPLSRCFEDHCLSPDYPDTGWDCDPWAYDAHDGCHCGCGSAVDPDCGDSRQPVVGCLSGLCEMGQCVPLEPIDDGVEETTVAANNGLCSAVVERPLEGPWPFFALLVVLGLVKRRWS